MNFAIHRERWMLSRNRQAVSRFSKSFGRARHDFRQRLGEILAQAAGAGLLRSGATIKQTYAAYEELLLVAVDECLELVSKKTSHMSRTRSWLLNQIEIQIAHHGENMNKMAIDLVVSKATQSPHALESAETICRQCIENAVDRVEQYRDGLIAPDDKTWAERYPIAKDLLLIAAGILMGSLLPN